MEKKELEGIYFGYFDFFSNAKTDNDNWINKLIEMYEFSRLESNDTNFELVDKLVTECEKKVPYKYILNVASNFQYDQNKSYTKKTIDMFSSPSELLDFIVNSARNLIFEKYWPYPGVPNQKGIDYIDVACLCKVASNYVKKVCDSLRIKNKIIRIFPGFEEKLYLFNGFRYHYFNLIFIGDRCYLVDCTYKQFFDINQCLLEKMGIFGMAGSLPGIYMIYDEQRKRFARKLIQNGWIELDEKNMKYYFDGFTLSFRNALYYENLGYIDFSTSYSANDYEALVFGDDNQANHENLLELGIQMKFLRNSNIKFKTDFSLIDN